MYGLYAFAKGAVFCLVVAGQILCNVLTILSLIATINGLLTWIGRDFGIHQLTAVHLELPHHIPQ